MPPEKPDVRSDSSTDKEDLSRSQTGDKTGLKDPEKQSWENQAKEYQRKHADLSEKYEAVLEEISDLKEKISSGDGSRGDREELERLKSRRDSLQEAKLKIVEDPQSKPWLSITEEVSDKVASQKTENAIYQYDYLQALKTVKKEAQSLKDENDKPIDAKQFEDELFEILKGGRWEFDAKGRRSMPTERIDNAIEEWHRLAKLKQDARKGEQKESQFAEGKGRTMQRSPSKLEEFKEAKETGKFANILAKKAGIQQEHFK